MNLKKISPPAQKNLYKKKSYCFLASPWDRITLSTEHIFLLIYVPFVRK